MEMIERKFKVEALPEGMKPQRTKKTEGVRLSKGVEEVFAEKSTVTWSDSAKELILHNLVVRRGEGNNKKQELLDIEEDTYLKLIETAAEKMVTKIEFNAVLGYREYRYVEIQVESEPVQKTVSTYFLDIEKAKNFVVPGWLGEEVTPDDAYQAYEQMEKEINEKYEGILVELNPAVILKEYDKYDIGDAPYEIKRDENGELVITEKDVYNAYRNNTQAEPKSEVRAKVLELVESGETEKLELVTNEFIFFLLQQTSKKGLMKEEDVEAVFKKNKLRFTRFFLDLPKEIGANFLKELITKSEEEEKRSFINLIDVKNREPSPLSSMVFEFAKNYEAK